jgi:hypothetical protein
MAASGSHVLVVVLELECSPASLILGCEVSCGTRGVTSMGCCCSLDRLLSGLIAIRKVGFAEVSQTVPSLCLWSSYRI